VLVAGGFSTQDQASAELYVAPADVPTVTIPSGTSLLLRVVDGAGNPVAAAAVSARDSLFPTDSSGHLLLENLQPGRFFARVDARGFTSASVVVQLQEGAHVGYQVKLLPLGTPIPFQAEQGGVIETPSVRVTLPPNAIVDALGQPVTGRVDVTIVPLDPTTQLAAMPGPLEGTTSAGGEPVPLESFFMAEVGLWHDGAPVRLAPGASATLEFVLPDAVASRFQPGDTVPAWWFDLDAGHWRREGRGTIQASPHQPGKLVWVVEVNHFTWWNCDSPLVDRSCIDVLVVDGEGRPVADVQVNAYGVSYAGSSRTVYTGRDGRACVEIKPGGTVTVQAGQRMVTVTGSSASAVCGGGSCTPVMLILDYVICVPGAYEDCAYSGSGGALGQGLCRAGRRQCDVQGTEWSTCRGEVLPTVETCDSPFDEDCDGTVNEYCVCTSRAGSSCYGGPSWTQGVGICRGGTVACDLFGNVACAGQQLPLPEDCSTPEDDDCDGLVNECQSVQWVWLPTQSSVCRGMATLKSQTGDGEGNLVLAVTVHGQVDFGGVPLSGNGRGFHVLKFNASRQPLWNVSFSGALGEGDFIELHASTVDRAGNVLVSGSFKGRLFVGGRNLSSGSGASRFLVKLAPTGAVLWARGLESSGSDRGWLATDSAGDIAITSSFASEEPDFDIIHVAKLDASTGEPVWSRQFSSPSSPSGLDITMDEKGDVVLVGSFQVVLDIDGAVFTTSTAGSDIFVVKLDGGTGTTRWSQSIREDLTDDLYPRVKVDRWGTVRVLASVDASSFRLTKLDTNGQVRWSRQWGASPGNISQEQLGLVLDAEGNAVVSGEFRQEADFGGGVRVADPASVFLAWYDPEGGYLTDRFYPGVMDPLGSFQGATYWSGTSIDAEGNVLLGGWFTGTVDFDTTPVTASCGGGHYLLKVASIP
jgi:hypothetical protein